MKCFVEDPNEICLADNCQCPCHDELWDSYSKYVEEHPDGR
jgi:hypothetical protein